MNHTPAAFGFALAAVLLAPATGGAQESWTLQAAVAATLGYGGTAGAQDCLCCGSDCGSSPLVTGLAARLSFSMTYGGFFRFGGRVVGGIVPRKDRHSGVATLMAVARVGEWLFAELGAGGGYGWVMSPNADTTGNRISGGFCPGVRPRRPPRHRRSGYRRWRRAAGWRARFLLLGSWRRMDVVTCDPRALLRTTHAHPPGTNREAPRRLGLLEQKEKNAERNRRTRRLIQWGTIVEEMMEKDEEFARSMRQRAARKLTRKIDREAMGLPVAGEGG